MLLASVLGVLAMGASGCDLVPQPHPPEPGLPDYVGGGPGGGEADAAVGDAGLPLLSPADGSSGATTDARDASLDGASSADGPAPPADDAASDAGSEAGDGPGDCQQEGAQTGPEGGE
jgi:hypothetical protein